jgi:hypothetical protein
MAWVNGLISVQMPSFEMGAAHVETQTSFKTCRRIANRPRNAGSATADWIPEQWVSRESWIYLDTNPNRIWIIREKTVPRDRLR